MKIPLTKNKITIVDKGDFEGLNKHKWAFDITGYAVRTIHRRIAKLKYKTIKVYMHHEILGKPKEGYVIDHRNMNRLDNRRKNLRFISDSESMYNRTLKKNLSGFRGVVKCTCGHCKNRWIAKINVNKKTISLGGFPTAELAGKAYSQAAKKYYGY